MNYYWCNTQEILQKEKKKHSKEKAAEYYKQDKEAMKEKAKERFKTCHKNKNTKLNGIKKKKKKIKNWFSIKKKR